MKKKNGFTLIELLAVIVILAVIALIAVPQVLKILNKARLSSAEDSTYGVVKAAESYVTNFMLQNNGSLPSEELVFDCDGTSCGLQTNLVGYNLIGLEKLEFKGTKPKSGTIRISNNGSNITTTDLVINNFVCGYIGGESICIEKGKYDVKENGTVIYFNPETNKQCNDYVETNSDTGNKTGCMKWYVYNDTENSMAYNLLLDHNTTASVRWSSTDSNTTGGDIVWRQLSSDTSLWQSNLNARLITAKEVNIITGNTSFDLTTLSYYKLTTFEWLMDRVSLSDTRGYWTGSAATFNILLAWRVDGLNKDIYPLRINYTDGIGVRPVISVSKSNIS